MDVNSGLVVVALKKIAWNGGLCGWSWNLV